MVDIGTESIFASTWVVAVIVIALLTTGLLPIVLGAVIVGLLLYALYVLVTGTHKRFQDRIAGRRSSSKKYEVDDGE